MFSNKTKIISFVQKFKSSYKVLQGRFARETLESLAALDSPIALLAKHQQDFKVGPNSELVSTIQSEKTEIVFVQGIFFLFPLIFNL